MLKTKKPLYLGVFCLIVINGYFIAVVSTIVVFFNVSTLIVSHSCEESHTIESETDVSVELLQAAKATIIRAKSTFFILY
jgi:hypothetical protein